MATEVPVALVPLDATDDVPVPPDLLERLEEDHAAAGANLAYELLVRFPERLSLPDGQLWDELAALAVADPFGAVVLFASLQTLSEIGFVLIVVSPLLVPVGIGVAILRYRLYEIDRIVSRTIAYAAVTAVLALVFVGANLVFQATLAPLVRADTLVVAGSTLLVAALFTPVRTRIQRAVDRRFHRARHDADRLAARFAERLRDEVDLETLRSRTLEVVDAAVEPSGLGLWLRRTTR